MMIFIHFIEQLAIFECNFENQNNYCTTLCSSTSFSIFSIAFSFEFEVSIRFAASFSRSFSFLSLSSRSTALSSSSSVKSYGRSRTPNPHSSIRCALSHWSAVKVTKLDQTKPQKKCVNTKEWMHDHRFSKAERFSDAVAVCDKNI